MNKNILIFFGVIVIIGVAGYFLLTGDKNKYQSQTSVNVSQETNQVPTQPLNSPTISVNTSDNKEVAQGISIEYTNNGFSPETVTIKSGSQITWINKSSKTVEIGADPHPAHTGNREVSGGKFVLTLLPGQQETVIVSKIGTFGYHNHIMPVERGTIVVTE